MLYKKARRGGHMVRHGGYRRFGWTGLAPAADIRLTTTSGDASPSPTDDNSRRHPNNGDASLAANPI
jgi:hypothetical protein